MQPDPMPILSLILSDHPIAAKGAVPCKKCKKAFCAGCGLAAHPRKTCEEVGGVCISFVFCVCVLRQRECVFQAHHA